MDLSAACAAFSTASTREALAEGATSVIEASQSAIRDGVVEDVAHALTRVIVRARGVAVEHAVRDVRSWAPCSTLSLIETESWDPFHLLLFLCSSHARTCLARMYADRGGWDDAWSSEIEGVDDEDFRALAIEDVRESREELEAGVETTGVRAVLTNHPFRRVAAALIVCLDGIVDEANRASDDLICGGASRPSRLGIRLIERHALAEDASRLLAVCIESHAPEESVEDLFAHADTMKEWLQRTVKIDANNALLLRLDDWAVLCKLNADDINFATGERGVVPREHHNAPAAWVAQRALPDTEYRELVASAKANDAHAENAYVAFSGTLEQHYGFEWLTRCFVARVNPVRAFRKTCEYLRSARDKTPPLVIQRANETACVLVRCADGVVRRVACASPAHALSAWMVAVERHAGGQFSRKANVADLIERTRNAQGVEALAVPTDDIGGANISIN